MRTQKISQENNYFDSLILDIKNLESHNLTWQIKDQLPKGKKIKGFTLESLKIYLLERVDKNRLKAIEAINKEYDSIENAPDFKSLNISIDWKRSQMYGMNPTATLEVWTERSYASYTAKVTGCGYCKLSAVMSDVFNQSLSLRKLILNNDRLTYGLKDTYFSGRGVGVNTLQNAFDCLGLKLKLIATGKTFDVFTVNR
jgi:hypothetical protein